MPCMTNHWTVLHVSIVVDLGGPQGTYLGSREGTQEMVPATRITSLPPFPRCAQESGSAGQQKAAELRRMTTRALRPGGKVASCISIRYSV